MEDVTITTATLRNLAREAEKRLDWAEAAKCWREAVARYPNRYPLAGALQDADIAHMTQRARSCEAML